MDGNFFFLPRVALFGDGDGDEYRDRGGDVGNVGIGKNFRDICVIGLLLALWCRKIHHFLLNLKTPIERTGTSDFSPIFKLNTFII